MISSDELKEAIKQSDIKIPDSDVEKIIEEVDYFGNGKINYTEFLVATVDVMKFLDEHMLQALFNQFDTDSSGVITQDNIISAMNKIGHQITQQDLDQIMIEHDYLKNGVITYEEFKSIFEDVIDKNQETAK